MKNGTGILAALAVARRSRERDASDGSAQGAQFQVNTYTTSIQRGPSVAAAGDWDFVVVWQSGGSSGTDTSGDSIQGQRYLPEPGTGLLLVTCGLGLAALARRRSHHRRGSISTT